MWATLAGMLFAVPPATGCVRGHGIARGAATVEELVDKYEEAHRERSIEKLRDILWWEAPQAGSGHLYDYEELMTKVFAVELDNVEYVAGPKPDGFGGGDASWVRRTPAGRRQVASVAGPVYGKLILVGWADVGGIKTAMEVDPAYVVMQSMDRYYIDIQSFVLEDAVRSIRTGEPSESKALPLGADPAKVPRNW
jgi:hypothetical protein